MVTVFWPILGFPVLRTLAEKKTFTYDSFCETFYPQFVEYAPLAKRHPGGRRLSVHMDSASPHRSKETTDCLTSLRLVSAPHLLYSPDPAPSDFHLFGKMGYLLTRKKFGLAVEFLHEISQIGRAELNAVFANWEVRLQKCITLDG
jgi:hypothetical protein